MSPIQEVRCWFLLAAVIFPVPALPVDILGATWMLFCLLLFGFVFFLLLIT